jgi:hypothetical protein
MANYSIIEVKKFENELTKVEEQKNGEALQSYFKGLARTLFNKIEILAGDDRYSFAEIEFYYQNERFKGGQYKDTYPRTKDAGNLFWHLSGIDICFETDKEKGSYYGGILIRSIVKLKADGSEDCLITGPMCCSDELLNSCVESSKNEAPAFLPILVDKENLNIVPVEPVPARRQGIEADKGEKALPFCFYTERSSWKNHKGYNYSACPEKRKIENNDNRRTDQ